MFPNIYWQHPRLLLPAPALAIGVLLWEVVVPQRARGWPGTSVIVAIVGLLVAELVYTLLGKEQTLLSQRRTPGVALAATDLE